jgi:hypothetical protein
LLPFLYNSGNEQGLYDRSAWQVSPSLVIAAVVRAQPTRQELAVTNVDQIITSEIVVAYARCPRKAHMLLYGDEVGVPHEYVRILEQHKIVNLRP